MQATTMLRASYSITAPTLQGFNAVIPPGERSRVVERFMLQALAEREAELTKIAAAFMADPANAESLDEEALWDTTAGDGLQGV